MKETANEASVDRVVMRDIPQAWIQMYVDKLIDLAKRFDNGSPMQTAVLMRADHAMDLVKAFRESA